MLNTVMTNTDTEYRTIVPECVSGELHDTEEDYSRIFSAQLISTLKKDITLLTKYRLPRCDVKEYLFLTKYRNSLLEYEVRALPAARQRLDSLINECYDSAGLP